MSCNRNDVLYLRATNMVLICLGAINAFLKLLMHMIRYQVWNKKKASEDKCNIILNPIL